jgi:hypothetical protein
MSDEGSVAASSVRWTCHDGGMSGPLPDTWYSRDFPTLIEIVRRVDVGQHARFEHLREALGFDDQTMASALRALERRQLVVDGLRTEEHGLLAVTEVSAEAYFVTGLHPRGDDDLEALIDAFRQAADLVDDPAEKSRLRVLADGLRNVSADIAKRVLAAYIAARIPS